MITGRVPAGYRQLPRRERLIIARRLAGQLRDAGSRRDEENAGKGENNGDEMPAG
jgi:hypothetical protein